MPLAVLLNPDDPLFDFEHQMAHRQYFAIMSPLPRFSTLPYQLDQPVLDVSIPAGDYHLRHRQSHRDFSSILPAFYQATSTGFGIPYEGILLNNDLTDPESRTWWTFLNHNNHYIANEAILPLPVTDPTPPGWWSDVNYLPTFW